MSRIVAAVDGSPQASIVLSWALDHATPDDEVVALTVWNLSSVFGLENPFGNLNEGRLEAVAHVKSLVDRVSRERWTEHRESIPVRVDVRHGEPGEELVLASMIADIIVIGGYHQGVRALGSVARYVVPRAHCAVTLVPLPALGSTAKESSPV